MGIYDIVSALAALIAVIAMILLSRNAWRITDRLRGAASRQGVLSVESSLPLDARRRLSVVSCHGRKVLLLTGGPSDVVVGWLPDSAQEETAP